MSNEHTHFEQELHDHAYLHAHGIAHQHNHVHANQKAVVNRLARAIGHLEKVKRMVEAGEDCSDVLVQLAAVQSALNNAGKVILQDHLRHCMVDAVAVIAVIASLFLEHQALKMGLLGAALALILAATLLRNRFWRCPKCGQVLSKRRPIHCSFCNWMEKK